MLTSCACDAARVCLATCTSVPATRPLRAPPSAADGGARVVAPRRLRPGGERYMGCSAPVAAPPDHPRSGVGERASPKPEECRTRTSGSRMGPPRRRVLLSSAAWLACRAPRHSQPAAPPASLSCGPRRLESVHVTVSSPRCCRQCGCCSVVAARRSEPRARRSRSHTMTGASATLTLLACSWTRHRASYRALLLQDRASATPADAARERALRLA